VLGRHTWQEWQELKERYNYKCVYCKISESKLEKKWGNKFSKLTEDHIIPISKGGSDYITNIQPLCISCNAKKKDK
jgi:5-methylcytosine-specific restriction endonuclease McrA